MKHLETKFIMIDDSDPDNWKLSVFYYNPDDSRVFVLKRSGLGITMNFARPISWVISVGILASLIYVAMTHH